MMTDPLDEVGLVDRCSAYVFVQKHHYSAVLPRLTKVCVGGWKDSTLQAVVTFGWGVRPLHTIRKAFPSLGPSDYLEIGKLCLVDELPRNSETWFLARALRICQQVYGGLSLIWTWADGILGKPRYVYQAANFLYGGFIWTEMYLDGEGTRVHPRTVQGMSRTVAGKLGPRDRKTTEALGLTKWWGKQFRYVLPLCSKRRWRQLQEESLMEWNLDYPKGADLVWEVQCGSDRHPAGPPPFLRGAYVKRGPQARLNLMGSVSQPMC